MRESKRSEARIASLGFTDDGNSRNLVSAPLLTRKPLNGIPCAVLRILEKNILHVCGSELHFLSDEEAKQSANWGEEPSSRKKTNSSRKRSVSQATEVRVSPPPLSERSTASFVHIIVPFRFPHVVPCQSSFWSPCQRGLGRTKDFQTLKTK